MAASNDGMDERRRSIRVATSDDVADLARITNDAYQKYVPRTGRLPAPMSDDFRARVERGEAFVCTSREVVVGLIILVREADGFLIENVAVEPSSQGRGYGRALLAFAESEARERGLPRIKLYTNASMHENIARYERLGYVETHRTFERSLARVHFTKTLGH